MKLIGFIIIILLSLNSFSQDSTTLDEEFIPITIEEKEAFMSTKTGEFVFREHAKTDATALKTTTTGVIYTDVKTHAVKKGETLSVIARNYGLSISALKTQNKLTKTGLSIGQKLKVVKKIPVKSSSPVIGTSGEETIVARLRPGQTPASLNAPSINITKEKEIKASVNNTLKPATQVITDKKEVSIQKKDEVVKAIVVAKKEASIEKGEAIKKDVMVTKKEVSIQKKDEVMKAIVVAKKEISIENKYEAMKVITNKKEASIQNGDSIKKDVVVTKKEKEASVQNEDSIKKDVVVSKKEVSVKESNSTKKDAVVSKEDTVNKIEKIASQNVYKVKKGDTLYSISKLFGMRVQDLKKMNGLTFNVLSIGQELKIN